MVYNPQKLTSYRVFDLLYTKQTRRKDRILGHCMAAGSHRLQRVRGGDIRRRRREIKIPTPPSPSPRHCPPQRATPRHSITAVHTSRRVITTEVQALSNAQLIRTVHTSNASFHPSRTQFSTFTSIQIHSRCSKQRKCKQK